VAPCAKRPVISGYGQVSPVSAELGENLTLTVFYYYLGTLPLTFVWYKDGLPLSVVTPVGPIVSLNIPGVALDDAGNYELGITPASCAQVLSSIIHVDVVCVQDIGLPAPWFDPATLLYDYTTITSRGIFPLTPTFVCGGPGITTRNYTDCGAFGAGYFDTIYLGGAWQINLYTADLPPCSVFSTEINLELCGVEMQISGLPTEFELPAVVGGYMNCAAAIAGAGGVGANLTFGYQLHDGGNIQMWSPKYDLNAVNCTCGSAFVPCGSFPSFELREYVLGTIPDNVRLKNFDDIKTRLTMCPTCEARNITEWDGTFPLAGRVYTPDTFAWRTNIDPDLASLNGKRLAAWTHILLSELLDGTPIWILEIHCKQPGAPNFGSGECIWAGYKDVGTDPTGIYLWDPIVGATGVACTPQEDLPCIEIESY
jgi:hypothetical protein